MNIQAYQDGKEDGIREAMSIVLLLREKFYAMKDIRGVNVLDRVMKELKERV